MCLCDQVRGEPYRVGCSTRTALTQDQPILHWAMGRPRAIIWVKPKAIGTRPPVNVRNGLDYSFYMAVHFHLYFV